jgi:hypothetical protein
VWLLVAATAHSPGASVEVSESLSREIEIDPQRAAAAAARLDGEVYRMKWRLRGFLGALAGLFVPNSGDALLTFVPREEGRQEIQVLITTPGHEGEYFLYGAEIDETEQATTEIWSSYLFRDSGREREQRIEQENVIDFASAIYHLRRNPPRAPIRMTIWNQGKTYPVEVRPLKPERRKISGTKTEVQGYAVRGVSVEGQPAFKEKFTLYFSRDAASTPLEIAGKRGWVKLRIQLVEEDVRKLAAGARSR